MSYFVGAYASSPNVNGWDKTLEKEYYDQLKTLTNMKGLEHPFVGKLHPHDDDWFLENIDPNWDVMFTCIPGIMDAIGQNPNFGIASDDEEGRLEALSFMKKACEAVAKLNASLGRQAVQAIEIQAAPNRRVAKASAKSLSTSLKAMLSWDWQGAQIVIEHCDAFVEGQEASKGFLSIEDEIKVLSDLNVELKMRAQQPLGMVINWGRSAIEARSISGPIEHIQKAKESGVLAGIMFSGASSNESDYGVWNDAHMPPSLDMAGTKGESASLLTEAEMNRCLQLADVKKAPLAILGVKLGIRPPSTSIPDRVAYNRDALAVLDRYFL
jgi:hypothetical protein